MLLKSIKLENIRSYQNQEINFPQGSTLLSGDIGSGKSSILLAIEFALFGFRGKALSGKTLLRHGKNNGSVELNFNINNQDIIIKRSLKRTKQRIQQTAGYIVKNGIKKDATAVELKSDIINLLGYPKELVTKNNLIYTYTIYTPQEEMRNILTEDQELRLDTLRKVFGIDKYKKIKLNTYIFIKQLKSKLEDLTERIQNLDEKLELKQQNNTKLKQLKQDLNQILPEYKLIEEEIKNIQELINKQEQDIKQLNELNTQLNINETRLNEKINQNTENKKQLEQIKDKINILKDKIKTEPQDITQKEEELNQLIQNKSKIEQQLNSITDSIAILEKELKEKRQKTQDLDNKLLLFSNLKQGIKDKESINNKIKETESLINDINKELNILETKKSSSNEIKNKVDKLEECPTCLQKVPDFHKKTIYESENKKILEFDEHITKLIKRKDETVKELERIRKVLQESTEKENKLNILKIEIENLKTIEKEIIEKDELLKQNLRNKEEIVAKLDIYKKQDIGDLKKQLTQLREQKRISDLLKEKQTQEHNLTQTQNNIKKDIGNINTEKIKLRENIEKYKNTEKEYQEAKTKYENIKNKEKQILIQKTALEKEIQGINNILTMLNKEIDEKLEIKNKIKNSNNYINWLEKYFMNLMNNIEKHVMFNVQREFDELFQDWFNMLMEDETINVRLDRNFTPIIEQNGYESYIENLSGGEKTAAALAYRLSLNRVINEIMSDINTKDLIILDEPTDGFSTEQLDKVRDVLEQLSTKQTIIVSHESKIESFVDNVIRINKNEHISSI